MTEGAGYEWHKINKIEQEVNRDNLIYKTGNDKTHDFQKFKTIRSFGREIIAVYLH